MAKPMNIDGWLKPSTVPKRKLDDAVDSEKENATVSIMDFRKKAKPNSGSKSKTAKVTSSTAAGKEAQKLYRETLKDVDKRVSDLDKKVKAMTGRNRSITTASYATSAGKHIKIATKLAAMDPALGFNLLLSLADASHTDLDATVKMCGTPCDSSVPTFTALDDALLPLIEKRDKHPQPDGYVMPSVPARWTPANADVGPFKTGRPNKQQRVQIYKQKRDWEKQRTAARRARREAVENWVAVALSDLKEERDYLAAYGVEEYLPKSIARLEELATASLSLALVQRTNRETIDEHGIDPGTFGSYWPEFLRRRMATPQEKKLNRTRRKLHQGKSREKIEQRRDREGEEPVADADDPPSLVTDEDQLARYKGVVVIRNFLGPVNLATGAEEAMRAPRDETGQELLQFAKGPKLYPSFLLNLSELERYNLVLPGSCASQPPFGTSACSHVGLRRRRPSLPPSATHPPQCVH
ncbi:hypothetical protein N0V82_003124 [Gnomoniopsis sp. IMI 355080]|nr:hypothetical protein N0V82_003124 [Gnomoniopsis sp. IMI 355080]